MCRVRQPNNVKIWLGPRIVSVTRKVLLSPIARSLLNFCSLSRRSFSSVAEMIGAVFDESSPPIACGPSTPSWRCILVLSTFRYSIACYWHKGQPYNARNRRFWLARLFVNRSLPLSKGNGRNLRLDPSSPSNQKRIFVPFALGSGGAYIPAHGICKQVLDIRRLMETARRRLLVNR